ncbi:MAG: AraC family transcriptional regulator [Clostridia bacterium]|nr:AraC family transcriptional regulator [Clostridia bacterium]
MAIIVIRLAKRKVNGMHNKAINCAIDYIRAHLEENLTVEDIAEQCHFSKFYFNRLFKSVVGESVYAFIKRQRIEKSALRMSLEPEKSITEIGVHYGYSASNYSVAFKKHYGLSPATFKKNRKETRVIRHRKYYPVDLTKKSYDDYNRHIRPVQLPDFEVIYQRFIGEYYNHPGYWKEFCTAHAHYIDEESKYFDISYDDPIITDENRCIADICITTTQPIGPDCTTKVIEGGLYMVYNFQGPLTKIFETFQGLMSIWMMGTSLTLDIETRKIVSHYKEINHQNNHVNMDIYIPVG